MAIMHDCSRPKLNRLVEGTIPYTIQEYNDQPTNCVKSTNFWLLPEILWSQTYVLNICIVSCIGKDRINYLESKTFVEIKIYRHHYFIFQALLCSTARFQHFYKLYTILSYWALSCSLLHCATLKNPASPCLHRLKYLHHIITCCIIKTWSLWSGGYSLWYVYAPFDPGTSIPILTIQGMLNFSVEKRATVSDFV